MSRVYNYCFPAFLCAIALLFPGRASAQIEEDLWGGIAVGVAAGYAVPNTDEYKNAFSLRFDAAYDITPALRVGLELGRFSTTVEQPDLNGIPDHTIASGTIRVMPVALNVQGRYVREDLYTTFFGTAGAGYYFIDYSWKDSVNKYFKTARENNPEEAGRINQKVDDTFGFTLGGGAEYMLTSSISLTGEARYLFLNPDAKGWWTEKDDPSRTHAFGGNLDLNTWLLSVGVLFLF